MKGIGRGLQLHDEALLALLDAPSGGSELQERLAAIGLNVAADRLLTLLLKAERSGQVQIDRDGGYSFKLTPSGEADALRVASGETTPLTIFMADLVGFVAYTEKNGDHAARDAAAAFSDRASRRFSGAGGRLIKQLGDGVLGTADLGADALEVMRCLASDCRELNGSEWVIRASAHRGKPVMHRGDLFGRDVNLTARLCDIAGPGEVVITSEAGEPGVEEVSVKGFGSPVAVRRHLLSEAVGDRQ